MLIRVRSATALDPLRLRSFFWPATLLLAAAFTTCASMAQSVPPQWDAQWIAAPDGPVRDYDVLYFRKSLQLASVPAHFMVDVSADNRYELHVNGRRVSAGPALADVHHWRYETVDLAPYLKTGANQLAAIVWNFGTAAPVSQISAQTAFLLSAEDPRDAAVNTGGGAGTKATPPETWMVSRERGRTIQPMQNRDFYYAAGTPEVIDGTKVQWDWDSPSVTNPAGWHPAKSLGNAAPEDAENSPTPWILHRDELPPMQYTPISAGHVVRASGLPGNQQHPSLDTSLDAPLTLPAHAHVTLLLDRDTLTTAFPSLSLEGGSGATIQLTYAEALYDDKGEKGNRNEITGRHISGVQDTITADGGKRTYRTLWWRTWRYLQIEATTGSQPLTVKALSAFYTAYPFKAEAHFDSSDPELTRIWDTGWRTAQLCSHETYMDTPYWEQLQYVGDTRIQALISYAVTGDDRLARQAMLAYRDSLLTDGLTQSRYPSSLTQVIPPFSLLWIGMLHDYWMYRPDGHPSTATVATTASPHDASFLQSLVPGTRGVIDWFAAHQRADGLLSKIEWWPFVDWSPPTYDGGTPPQDADGGSSVMTLQWIEALSNASELEAAVGEPGRANRYLLLAKRAADGLMSRSWNETTGLLADTPAMKSYSQQANSLAVLLDVVPPSRQRAVMEKVLASQAPHPATQMAAASYYFRFYLARALVHAGLGDQYLPELDPWRRMLQMGLSTWAEQPEPTRSDSHAWSAHPTLDLLTLVAGIAPGSPGFATVRITPHLGSLQHASAQMPTPKGIVDVHYEREHAGWKATVTLPDGLPGELAWHDQLLPLHPGRQQLRLP